MGQPIWRTRHHEECRMMGCRREPNDVSQVCQTHFVEIGYQFYRERKPMFESVFRRELTDEEREEHERREAERLSRSVVYYIRIGDHVKIGTSINVSDRLRSFYLDESALLATEPGGYDLEKQRHREFADERVSTNRELFNPSRRLLAHIEELAKTKAA